MTAAPDARRRELAQIHIAKAQLGMDEETYRAMLWTVGRVDSSAKLDYAGRKAVLDHLKACGFKAKAPKQTRPGGWDWVNKAAPDRQAMLRKIAVMLKSADREKHYADGVAKHMFGIELIEFCAPDQLHRVVTALAYDARRRASRALA